MSFPKRAARGLLLLLCATTFLPVLSRAWFELAGSYHSDVSIFLTVSRGILNGLLPYSDLFENKAPGIYLLGALSLRFFDDARLLSWAQAAVTVLLPVCLSAVAWTRGRRLPPAAIAWIFGCVLALYSGYAGGQVFIESYAAFFGSLFVGFLWVFENRRERWVPVVLALPLIVAIGFKEPMFFSIMGGALITLPSWSATRRLLWPVGILFVAGVLGLAVFGYTHGYVTVYLPHIIGHHLFHPWGTVGEPLWLRTIDLVRLYASLRQLSPVLPMAAGAVWIGALALLLRRARTRRERLSSFGRWLLASWLTLLPVGLTGDFYFHHFVFSIPGMWGFFFCCLREIPSVPPRVHIAVQSLFTTLLIATLLTTAWSFDDGSHWRRTYAAPRQRAAAVLDAVMDRCNVNRYLNIIDRPDGVYGFARHSPYGPIFTQYGRFVGVLQRYLQSFIAALHETPLILVKEGEETVGIDTLSVEWVKENFSDRPWPCAGAIDQPLPYRILFKTGAR